MSLTGTRSQLSSIPSYRAFFLTTAVPTPARYIEMNYRVRYALLITFLMWQSNTVVADTTITLKGANNSPMNIGWVSCQPGDSEVRANDFNVALKTLTQYGEEAKLRSDWLRTELGVDHKIAGLSWAEFISLLALIVSVTASVVIARVQHRHNKKSQAKVLTLKIWEEYLGKHKEITEALEVLDKPLYTQQPGFSIVHGVRAWLDGIASLDDIGELDRGMLKALTMSGPLKAFMDKLDSATKFLELKKADGVPAGITWAQSYRDEITASHQIIIFLERIKGHKK